MINTFEAIEHMKKAAVSAGEFLASQESFNITKKDDASYVTNLDVEVQNIITEYLTKFFPDIPYVLEEGDSTAVQDVLYQWCIDPIDGTHNFIQGIPYYGFSIGLLKNKKPYLGVIYDPVRKKIFSHDTIPQHLNHEKKYATIASGRGHDEKYKNIEAQAIQSLLAQDGIKYRRFSSAALDLAHLAHGNIDGVILIGNSIWDYAAGFALLQDRDDITISECVPHVFVVSRNDIHGTLVSIIQSSI